MLGQLGGVHVHAWHTQETRLGSFRCVWSVGGTVARDSSQEVWAKFRVAPPFALQCWCERTARRPSRAWTRQVHVASVLAIRWGASTGSVLGLVPLAVVA